MNLQKASDKLHDLLALSRGLRAEMLQSLVATDLGVCFLLSMHSLYSQPTALVVKAGGETVDYNSQLHGLLHDRGYWRHLGMKEQVVLRELLSTKSKAFDSIIFYSYAIKVYTKEEIEKELSYADNTTTMYLMLPQSEAMGRKYYYITNSNGRIVHNTLPISYPKFYPTHNTTLIVGKNKKVIGEGTDMLGHYLHGSSTIFGKVAKFKKASSLVETQYVLDCKPTTSHALVLRQGQQPLVLTSKRLTITLPILDFIVDGSYIASGVFVEYGGDAYKVHKLVPQYIIDEGLVNYDVTIKYNTTVNAKLINIKFLEFKRKDSYDNN